MSWKRIMLTEFGGPEQLEVQTVDALPEPEGSNVRIRVCQRRSKTRPKGGAKVGHFGVGREGRIERWRPVDRAPQIAGG